MTIVEKRTNFRCIVFNYFKQNDELVKTIEESIMVEFTNEETYEAFDHAWDWANFIVENKMDFLTEEYCNLFIKEHEGLVECFKMDFKNDTGSDFSFFNSLILTTSIFTMYIQRWLESTISQILESDYAKSKGLLWVLNSVIKNYDFTNNYDLGNIFDLD